MNNSTLRALIKETVRTEIKIILEKNKNRTWQEGDKIPLSRLESSFKVFHLSNHYLGPNFTFTPRVPLDAYMSAGDGATPEDDFTKRISLAPSIKKAAASTSDGLRRFIYVGDIEGYDGDEVDTLDLAAQIPNCPSSKSNKYGENFSLVKWVMSQIDSGRLHPSTEKSLVRRVEDHWDGSRELSPKSLPRTFRDQFHGCVPDAKRTKEMWSLEATQLLNVAEYKGNFYLTEIGAEVFNAIDGYVDEIPYE